MKNELDFDFQGAVVEAGRASWIIQHVWPGPLPLSAHPQIPREGFFDPDHQARKVLNSSYMS